MGLAFTAYFVSVLIVRIRGELLERRLRVMQANRARG
jgi:hypothetical protein